ncbi:MAG: MATE family efflux transporter [Bacilli bacterium]|nr:MATE family efflux transporter [Bacilli bacterium]
MKKLDLGKEKISKLLLAFSIPCIISMLINSVYNIVDQIFIGKGVGTIGNAATNVIFPIVIICNAVAGLIGNGSAANLSLRLGEGKKEEASKSVASSITLLFISAIVVAIIGELLLPALIKLFGSTPNVYDSAITYGRIILLGAPFMIVYTGLSSIIRSDGSPRYAMFFLCIGAVINLVLDPIFIFKFNWGVAGGAYATIIGQIISFIIAILYLRKFKSVKINKSDYKLTKEVLKSVGLGLSSFITQMTVMALFIVMNNLMTKYGASSIYGSDIPLSVYGVISKLNSFYVSAVLGISIGAQPIIGYNYGARNLKRVKETLKLVLIINFTIGIIFNLILQICPQVLINLFISKSDVNYDLFLKFGIACSRIFLGVCFLNAFEMTCSIVIQSLGNVVKSTLVSFTRQIILFIPLSIVLCHIYGLYGALYAGIAADTICFIVVCFIFSSEYKKLNVKEEKIELNSKEVSGQPLTNYVITIAREYGSGGRYVGKLLASKLNIPIYDKEIIMLDAKKSGFAPEYVKEIEEKKNFYQNDNLLFEANTKVIENLAKQPCVIVGRCSDYILKDNKNVIKVFLYSNLEDKINRGIKYYHLDKDKAKRVINKTNKERKKYYENYTGIDWGSNYDISLNVDSIGVEKVVDVLINYINNK